MLLYGIIIHEPAPTWPAVTLMAKFVCDVVLQAIVGAEVQ
jgi:hypothetical protein